MIARLSKALLVLTVGPILLLVGSGNIIAYQSNFVFVQHVMAIDTVFPETSVNGSPARALTDMSPQGVASHVFAAPAEDG